MPTLLSKKLSDLQTERESLKRYERQIIQERDLILTSVRDHLLQLDREIVRLGGSPREEQESSPEAVLSPRNDNGSQKKRGRKKKEAPTLERMNDEIHDHDGEGKENRSNGKGSSFIGEAWTCECGKHMAAGRARCGACRRWKGGKRLTRWTIKKDSSSTSNLAVMGSSDGSTSSSCGASKVFNTYKNISSADVKPSSGMEIEEVMKDMVSAIDLVGLATQKTSDDIVFASKKNDENATDTSNNRKRGRPKKITAVSSSDSDDGLVINPPRNRGRPRKQLPMSALAAQQGEISFSAVDTEIMTESKNSTPEVSGDIETIASG